MAADPIDTHVQDIHRLAGRDAAVPPGVVALAIRIFPASACAFLRPEDDRVARARRIGRLWTLRVHPELDGVDLVRELALAVADWYLTEHDVAGVDRQELAARLVVPSPALAILHRLLGYDAAAIARILTMTEEAVLWRMRDVFFPEKSGVLERIPSSERAGGR